VFEDAIELSGAFTHPVVVSTLRHSGAVEASIAAFVIVNVDGWALTAGHVLTTQLEAERDRSDIDKWQAQVDAIRGDTSLSPSRRKGRLSRLAANPKWIANHSYWWAADGVTAGEAFVDQVADLALVQLKDLPPHLVGRFPEFGNPESHIRVGAPLCRQGFPFNAVQSSYDAATKRFTLTYGPFGLTRLALDGIHTRTCVMENPATGQRAVFLETSSPGLGGQSGGPIFDEHGTIWAIQSRTIHLELGFSPSVTTNGRTTVEHQFLNLGLGSDIAEITSSPSS